MARERPSLAELQPKPKNDAYTVLLSISLVAMIAACLLLWYDLKRYGDKIVPPKDWNPSSLRQPQPGGFDGGVPPIAPPGGGVDTPPDNP